MVSEDPDIDLDACLGVAWRQHIAALRAAFESAEPFPHLCIDGFLNDDFASAIHAAWPAFVGERQKSNISDVRRCGPHFEKLDDLVRSRAFLALVSELTGIEALHYDPVYSGGGVKESRPGATLPAHIDFNYHPHTGYHRRLNLLVYFNPDWMESYRGAIEIHRDPNVTADSLVSSFLPIFNRCVLFETSETSWHRVSEVTTSTETRKTFALYYFTESRPGPKPKIRNTVYVEDPLPAFMRPGHVLTEADVRSIKRLIAHRDLRIKQLFERDSSKDELISTLRSRLP